MHKYVVVWTGWTGAPAYSTFYVNGGNVAGSALAITNRLRTFFEVLKARIPGVVTITYPSTAIEVDDATGDAIDSVSFTAPAVTIGGASTSTFAAVAGASITWNTNTFISGRRVRGRTFIVPLSGQAYQGDGTLLDADRTLILGAASSLISGLLTDTTTLSVWHRPTPGNSDGQECIVTAAAVSDKVAVLKSRRD